MKKKYISLSVVILLAAACAKEGPDTLPAGTSGPEAEVEDGAFRTVCGVLDEALAAGTRNSLVDEDGSRYLLWSAGDVVGLSGSVSGTNVRGLVSEASAGRKEADIVYSSRNLTGGVRRGYYPFSASASLSGSILTTALSPRQTYKAGSAFDTGITILAARNEDGKLRFRHACSILKVQLTGSGRLTALSLRSAAQPLAGTGTVDLDADEPQFVVTGDASYGIDLDLGEGVDLSSTPVPFYFVIPPGTYTALSVVAVTDAVQMEKAATGSHTFAARHIAPMKAWAVACPSGDVTDLSAGGAYANCYRLDPSAAGRYSFDLKKVSGADAAPGAVSADWLWQTSPGLVSEICFDKAAGRVYFTRGTDGTPGNALLCAFDRDDRVLWSWHLWISEVVDQTFGRMKAFTNGSEPFTVHRTIFMDRNLGATYSPATVEEARAMGEAEEVAACGFLYQWGRSIPFPSRGTFQWASGVTYEGTNETGYYNAEGNNVPAGAFERYTAPVVFNATHPAYTRWEVRNLVATKAELLAWPLSFNKILGKVSSEYGTSWATDVRATGEGRDWSDPKTDTDPCPAGYRVPKKTEAFLFRSDGASYLLNGSWVGYVPYTHRGADYGGYFTAYAAKEDDGSWVTDEADRPFIFLPRPGFRSGGGTNVNNNNWTGVLSKGHLLLWTFYPGDDGALPSGGRYYASFGGNYATYAGFNGWAVFNYSGDIYQQYMYMTDSNCYEDNGSGRLRLGQVSAACSVRCVKIG